MLKEILKGKVVFVGVGNPLKGDDGFGPLMAEKIPSAINAEATPENFVPKIKIRKPDSVIIFDALDFGGKAGEVKVVKASDAKGLNLSTHTIPLSKFSEMLSPFNVWLVGVQPTGVSFGAEMSKEVIESAGKLEKEVLAWLNSRP
ncbi:MAG: hydrogenase maturation protease [Candidatus Micrarchaeota archaeon]